MGGTRSRPGQKTAESWVVHENNQITSGSLAGKTLIEAVNERGPEIFWEMRLTSPQVVFRY